MNPGLVYRWSIYDKAESDWLLSNRALCIRIQVKRYSIACFCFGVAACYGSAHQNKSKQPAMRMVVDRPNSAGGEPVAHRNL